MGRVFANGLGDQGSIPGQAISETQKMVLDTSLLTTQYYKIYIKGKVEQSRRSTHPYTSIENGSLRSPLTTVANFYFIFI